MQEVREDIQYHALEFESINFILEDGRIPRMKLFKTKVMLERYLRSRDYQLGMGIGKDGSGIVKLRRVEVS